MSIQGERDLDELRIMDRQGKKLLCYVPPSLMSVALPGCVLNGTEFVVTSTEVNPVSLPIKGHDAVVLNLS